MSGRLLGINLDHVATVREVRRVAYPDLAAAVRAAEAGGADFITAHLREDRRHIQDADVVEVLATCSTWLNLEISIAAEMVAIACSQRPRSVCLVPENREELTTEGGLNAVEGGARLRSVVSRLQQTGSEVSLFIEAASEQIEAAVQSGANAIELHTGRYAEFFTDGDEAAIQAELDRLATAARQGQAAGLKVNAGHGLTIANVGPVARIEDLTEFNIGHSIVADALFCGLTKAVERMRIALGL